MTLDAPALPAPQRRPPSHTRRARRALATLAICAAAGQASLAAAAVASGSAMTASSLESVTSCPVPNAGAASGSAVSAAPSVAYPTPAASIGASGVMVKALVDAYGKGARVYVRFGESPGFARCTVGAELPARDSQTPVAVPLEGLIPRKTYHFQVGAASTSGTSYGQVKTFTAPGPPSVRAGVRVGRVSLGGATRAQALKLLEGFLVAPLRFAFEGAYWHASRAQLGAQIDLSTTVARALAAQPGSHLALSLTIDRQRLESYLAELAARFAHPATHASIRLVGKRALITPTRAAVRIDMIAMTSAIRSALDSGLSERLRLIVDDSPTPSHEGAYKAVVVRLGSQTLTAYLNGKPLLTTPVTTGRAALPTPVGNYHVIFRSSPFVFHSPWPPGSPYWYPPTPVTWAMDFFSGDFLHDDPGEPTSAFGRGSEYGPYASHGCVHVPHAVMAFLYNWLPIGAQVVVSQD